MLIEDIVFQMQINYKNRQFGLLIGSNCDRINDLHSYSALCSSLNVSMICTFTYIWFLYSSLLGPPDSLR